MIAGYKKEWDALLKAMEDTSIPPDAALKAVQEMIQALQAERSELLRELGSQ